MKKEVSLGDFNLYLDISGIRIPEVRLPILKPIDIPKIDIDLNPIDIDAMIAPHEDLEFQNKLLKNQYAFFDNKMSNLDFKYRDNYKSKKSEPNYGEPVYHKLDDIFMIRVLACFTAKECRSSVWYNLPRELFQQIITLMSKLEQQESVTALSV